MPTFQSLLPYRNPLFQLRQCLPVWTCLLNASSACLCLFKEDFSSAIHPGTLCLLYMYLPISIIYSFCYIYNIKIHVQRPHPPSQPYPMTLHLYPHPTSIPISSIHILIHSNIQHPRPCTTSTPSVHTLIYICYGTSAHASIAHVHIHIYIFYFYFNTQVLSLVSGLIICLILICLSLKWISFLPCYTMNSLEIAI